MSTGGNDGSEVSMDILVVVGWGSFLEVNRRLVANDDTLNLGAAEVECHLFQHCEVEVARFRCELAECDESITGRHVTYAYSKSPRSWRYPNLHLSTSLDTRLALLVQLGDAIGR